MPLSWLGGHWWRCPVGSWESRSERCQGCESWVRESTSWNMGWNWQNDNRKGSGWNCGGAMWRLPFVQRTQVCLWAMALMYWELRDLGIFLSFYQHSFSCLCSFKDSPWPLCLSYTHRFIDYFPFFLQLFSRLFFLSLYSPISSWILHPLIQNTESLGCALVTHMEFQSTLTFVSLIHCWQHGNKKTYYPLSY